MHITYVLGIYKIYCVVSAEQAMKMIVCNTEQYGALKLQNAIKSINQISHHVPLNMDMIKRQQDLILNYIQCSRQY